MSALRALVGLIKKGDVLANLKAQEAKWNSLLPHLDPSLTPFVSNIKLAASLYQDLQSKQPELVKEIANRVEKDPMCTGVVATVAEARDPLMCTYTLEGSLAHQMMNEVKLLERKENG